MSASCTSLPAHSFRRLGGALRSLLAVGVAFALLVFGAPAAHAEHELSTAFGNSGLDDGQFSNPQEMDPMAATAPLAPVVEDEWTERESITSTHAILLAIVNPEFADTHYFFEYGPTAAYGTEAPLPPGTDIGVSNSGQNAAVALSGLIEGTTYHFRVVAANSLGTTDGPDETFTTATPAAPTVGSEEVASITPTTATLQAAVNPEFTDTHYFFEYGPTAAYGSQAPLPPGTDIGEIYYGLNAEVALSGLAMGTTYHFRVVAANSLGTADGPDQTFMTATPATPAAPTVESEEVASITPTTATLQTSVNPESADTHYFFEYGPTAAYGTQLPLSPGTDIGASNTGQAGEIALSGLAVGTTYHFRVVATNSIGSTDGPDQTFTTSPPAAIDSVFETNVTATAADLDARVDPEKVETHYRFEYGPTPSYGLDAPTPEGVIKAAEGAQDVAVDVQGLQPSTKYYLRVVATNAYGTETGSPQSFTTYATGESPRLPDNRAYELVSPPDKNSGDVGGGTLQEFLATAWATSSASGSAIAYASFTSFGGAQSAQLITQYLASRGPEGWTTQGISPPSSKDLGIDGILSRYLLFNPELTAGVLAWAGGALVPDAPETEGEESLNLYVHRMGAGTYELATTVGPPAGTSKYKVTFEGGSEDFGHVVFDATAALTVGAPANAQSVYEWVSGSLRLVSVLPGPGEVAAESAGAGDGEGGEESLAENAVSADGSRVFWTDNNKQLYVRENGTRTVKLNTSERTPSLGDGSALFRGATPDGSRVFFTDSTSLTDGPNDNGGLYEYDFSNGKLTDLSPDSSGSPGVDGVMGIGEDGLSVYFVASASIAKGATASGDNLYLSRDGAIKFIATLSSEDSSDWTQNLEERTARVTPSGEYLAFMSEAPLTGYDNIDSGTGSPDTEVFVYEAGIEHLSCASCNPSGARPVGPAKVPPGKHTDHIPRYLSDDGQRVFFDSKDVLLPSDTNGLQNVYEYENGTIHLISPGDSEDISSFADASANGDDVFFTTRARLVPEDKDVNSDLYDARVDGGFPAPVSPPPQCADESCRGPLSAPPTSLGVATETSGAPETAPTQPKVMAPTPKRRPHKSRAKIKGHKSKSRKSARKSNVGDGGGRHRGRRSSRNRHRRGGHTS